MTMMLLQLKVCCRFHAIQQSHLLAGFRIVVVALPHLVGESIPRGDTVAPEFRGGRVASKTFGTSLCAEVDFEEVNSTLALVAFGRRLRRIVTLFSLARLGRVLQGLRDGTLNLLLILRGFDCHGCLVSVCLALALPQERFRFAVDRRRHELVPVRAPTGCTVVALVHLFS